MPRALVCSWRRRGARCVIYGHDVDGVNRIRQWMTVRLPPLGAVSGRDPPLPTGKGPTMNYQQPPNGPANPYGPNGPNRPYAPYRSPYPPSGVAGPQLSRTQGPWPPAEATKRRGLPVWLIVTIAAVTTLVLLITVGTIATTQTRTVTHADDTMTASPTAPHPPLRQILPPRRSRINLQLEAVEALEPHTATISLAAAPMPQSTSTIRPRASMPTSKPCRT